MAKHFNLKISMCKSNLSGVHSETTSLNHLVGRKKTSLGEQTACLPPRTDEGDLAGKVLYDSQQGGGL